MAASSSNKTPTWVTFAGQLLLLVGAFFALRTIANFFLFPKYPLIPSTSFVSLTSFSPSGYDEASCQGDETCTTLIKDNRTQAMVVDVTNSALFLFVGGGILYTRKRFYHA